MRYAFSDYTSRLRATSANPTLKGAAMLLAAILCAGTTEAATYYVSTAGADSNSCATAQGTTQSSQKRTVAAGVACATTPGDAVYIHGGTYTGSGATIDSQGHTVYSGTSYTTPITISGYPGETAILYPDYNVSGVRLTTAVSYIIIQDLTIDMAGSTYPATAEGVMVYLSHHIRMQRLDIKNGPAFGVHSGDETPFIEVLNSKIHHFGRPGSVAGDNHGLYMTGSDALYEGNDIYDNQGYGLHIYNNHGSHADPSRTVTRNNRVHDNGTHGSSEYGIVVTWGTDNVVYNNLVYNNPGGIQVYNGSTGAQVYNNTVYNNKPDAGIAMQYYGAAPTVRNNIVFGNATSIIDYGGTGTPIVDHNVTTDPSFTNASASDFTLRPGSAALDTGASMPALTNDFSYSARPQGAGYDIGAFEAGGAIVPTAPAAPTNLRVVVY